MALAQGVKRPLAQTRVPRLSNNDNSALDALNRGMAIASTASIVVGYALAAGVAALGQIQVAFVLDGLTFLFSAASIMILRIPGPSAAHSQLPYLRSLTGSLRVVATSPALRPILGGGIVVYALVLGVKTQIITLVGHYTSSVAAYVAVEFVMAVGMLAGATGRLARRLMPWATPTAAWTWLILPMAAAYAFAALPSTVAVAAVGLAAAGATECRAGIAYSRALHLNTPEPIRDEVYALRLLVRDLVDALAILAIGALVLGVGPNAGIALAAGAMTCLALLMIRSGAATLGSTTFEELLPSNADTGV